MTEADAWRLLAERLDSGKVRMPTGLCFLFGFGRLPLGIRPVVGHQMKNRLHKHYESHHSANQHRQRWEDRVYIAVRGYIPPRVLFCLLMALEAEDEETTK